MFKTLMTAAGSTAVALTLLAGSAQQVQAQSRGDYAVYFTFSQPVTLPRVTLPAGRYLFRVADSLVQRTIVQIYSADGMRLHAMMMTLPTMRPDTPEDPEIRFLETAANTPAAIATYWYPGQKTGWEFIYPREQAMALARGAQQPVLTTARDTRTEDELRTAELERVSPSGERVAIDTTRETAVAGESQRGEIATDAPTVMAQNTTAARQSAAAAESPRTALPATASSRPAILLTGIVALMMALGLGLWRRVRA